MEKTRLFHSHLPVSSLTMHASAYDEFANAINGLRDKVRVFRAPDDSPMPIECRLVIAYRPFHASGMYLYDLGTLTPLLDARAFHDKLEILFTNVERRVGMAEIEAAVLFDATVTVEYAKTDEDRLRLTLEGVTDLDGKTAVKVTIRDEYDLLRYATELEKIHPARRMTNATFW